VHTALPDVSVEELTADHEFIVLACDGIWDVLSSQEVVDFVRVRIAQQMEPEIVSTSNCLFNFSCAPKGATSFPDRRS